MASLSNSVNLTIRIDKKLKKDVDILFKNLGTNTSSAITMFLRQCDREQGFPFIPTIESKPTRSMKKALKEAENIKNGKVKTKGYHNVDTFFDDMLK